MFLSTLRPRGKPAPRAQRRCHSPPPLTVDALEPRRFFAAVLPGAVTPPASSSPWNFTLSGDAVYFTATGPLGEELYRAGAPATLLKDIAPLRPSSRPRQLTDVNGTLFFTASAAGTGARDLWKTDGTPDGTVLVKQLGLEAQDPMAAAGFSRARAANVDGTYFLLGAGPTNRLTLWTSDGTEAGTAAVDAFTPFEGEEVGDAAVAGDVLYFETNFGRLWRSDGTAAGTYVADTGVSGLGAGFVGEMYYYRVYSSSTEVWATTGTADRLVKTFPAPAAVRAFVVAGGKLFFQANDGTHGGELWTTDGTTGGTTLVKDIRPGSFGINVAYPTPFDGDLFFSASDGTSEALWRSDGTAEGTVPVKRFAQSPGQFTIAAGTLYFTEAGSNLWRTDGTEAATRLIATLPAHNLQAHPGGVYFSGLDSEHGAELWHSDGTTAGTALADDINPGPQRAATIVGRHLVYRGSPAAGGEVAGAPADVASDKAALLPGQRATFANVSSYSRGINAVAIDAWDLGGNIPFRDFEVHVSDGADTTRWTPGPAPALAYARGAGVDGSDRVFLFWPDGAIRNRWLRVTIKPSPTNRLAAPEVFYFASLPGDTGAGGDRAGLRVDALDLAAVRRGFSADASDPAGPAARLDFNRDGRVDATDYNIARLNLSASLARSFTAPVTPAAPLAARAIRDAPATRLLAEPTPRRSRYDLPA